MVIALALTYLIISISKIPYIHTDAQYYLQSALLWPDGNTTFAASWIGGRDFAVWIYFLAFRVFGPGIDSIVLALAVIRLATVAALTVFCLCLIPEKIWAVAASLALAAGVLGLPLMNIPATDNVGLMLGAVVLALWALAARASFSWPFVLSFSFFTGVAYTVRAESLLLLLVILTLYLAKGAVRPRSAWLYGSVALLAGIALPSAMWVTWVPTPKPAVYGSAIGVYRPIADFGSANNGPASAQMGKMLGIDSAQSIPYWSAVSTSYRLLGPRESDRLITSIGLEAISVSWPRMLRSGADDFMALLRTPGVVTMLSQSPDARWVELRKELSELDEYRRASSEQFGNDAVYPTASLLDVRLKAVDWIQHHLSVGQLEISLPGWWLLVSLAVSVAAAIRSRDWLWLAVPLYGLAVVALAALSQGQIYRYIAPALLLNAAWTFVALFAAVRSLAFAQLRTERSSPVG